MNKLEGLLFLKKFNLPTLDLLDYNKIIKKNYTIKNGLSLRLSSKKDNIDVNLPSIHNCLEKEIIKKFYEENYHNYNIIIHKTVNPSIIGSISKYSTYNNQIIVIETYENFLERKRGIIKDREIYKYVNDKYIISPEKANYYNIANIIKTIPFETYDIEFVIEKEKIIFTDFYSKDFSK